MRIPRKCSPDAAAHHPAEDVRELDGAAPPPGLPASRSCCARETAADIAKRSAPMSTARKRSAWRFSSFGPCSAIMWKIERESRRVVRSRYRRCVASGPNSENRGHRPQPSQRVGYHVAVERADLRKRLQLLLARAPSGSTRSPATARCRSSASRAMKSRMISDEPSKIRLIR